MGQYYRPVSLDTMEHLSPYAFDNGAKLMEHSYIGNNYVAAVELLLIEGGRWDKHRIVWAGDYADGEKLDSPLFHKKEHSAEDAEGYNLYELLDDSKELSFLITASPTDHIYLVNFDKKEYVDKTKIPNIAGWSEPTQINPLPLLTAEGNGRGVGDFRGEDPNELIGSWARNRIGLRNAIPEGFTEVIFDLKE